MSELMTVADFQKKSSKFMARRKNPLILDIDKLLTLYATSADNPRRRLKILVLLYIWTKQYLHAGGTRGGVRELMDQVKLLLDQPINELTVTLARHGAAWKEGQMKGPETPTGKAMGEGYKMEPYLPGKGTVGGVQLQHDMKRINTPALRLLFEDKVESKLQKDGGNYSIQQVIHLAEEAMNSAPISEFLDVYFDFTQSVPYSTRAEFEYCDKEKRENYRVYINDADGCFYKDAAFTTPFTTNLSAVAAKNRAFYVVDLKARLYCKYEGNVADGAFNHSSFTSGKPVLCAGMLEADNSGRLTYLSNESGHYRPTPGDLGNVLAMLHDDYNINMDAVTVVIVTGTRTELFGIQAMNIYRNYPTTNLNDF